MGLRRAKVYARVHNIEGVIPVSLIRAPRQARPGSHVPWNRCVNSVVVGTEGTLQKRAR